MARRGRWSAREGEMRAVLAKWERSRLPLSRFADREGISQKTLYRWRRRLGVGAERVRRGRPPAGPTGGGDRSSSRSAQMFTEVSTTLLQASSSAITFEVVLGDGTLVRVPERFDPGSLRILLETLRGC